MPTNCIAGPRHISTTPLSQPIPLIDQGFTVSPDGQNANALPVQTLTKDEENPNKCNDVQTILRKMELFKVATHFSAFNLAWISESSSIQLHINSNRHTTQQDHTPKTVHVDKTNNVRVGVCSCVHVIASLHHNMSDGLSSSAVGW